ncbi:aspartate carbamoyltransferase regulatory subunit [Lutispora saccharofermentans]|uniref:Aspartate carbamoyltransferase regulatory subunit n=1 Tax=Lutispora saccharofermentans TaxID=3024236 RepID=A0ABT1NAN9_9FIRM|nr:aspartate carbamoyltransferase regulatory subunit [Lutispora saccharofermentans]MCQ1528176.1 aspartate carbamoyltransferase regulatory subunit [Lutispora saccharofermentans]
MLKVESIHYGIVIDHITQGKGKKIFDKLNLGEADFPVVLLRNVTSSKYGKKDIIKIENCIDVDMTILGLIDPNVTINIVENETITKKMKVEIPEEVHGLFKCKNPRCISNAEDNISPLFKLVKVNGTVEYSCEYCEEHTSYML